MPTVLRYDPSAMRALILVVALVLVGCVEPRRIEGPNLEGDEVALVFFVGTETSAYVIEPGAAIQRAIRTETEDVYFFVYDDIVAARVQAPGADGYRRVASQVTTTVRKGQPVPASARILGRTYDADDASWTPLDVPPVELRDLTIECPDGELREGGCDTLVNPNVIPPTSAELPEALAPVEWPCPGDRVAPDGRGCAVLEPLACTNTNQRWDLDDGCVSVGTCGSGEWPDVAGADVIYVRAGATGGNGTQAMPVGTLAAALPLVSGAGATIALAPGAYDANLSISSSVDIVGRCAEDVVLSGSIAVAAASSVRLAGLRFEGVAASSISGALELEAMVAVGMPLTVGAGATLSATNVALNGSALTLVGDATLDEVALVSNADAPTVTVTGGQTTISNAAFVAPAGALVSDGARLIVEAAAFDTDSPTRAAIEARSGAHLELSDASLRTTDGRPVELLADTTSVLTNVALQTSGSDSAVRALDATDVLARDLTIRAAFGIEVDDAPFALDGAFFDGDLLLQATSPSVSIDRVDAVGGENVITLVVETGTVAHARVQASSNGGPAAALRIEAARDVRLDGVQIETDGRNVASIASTDGDFIGRHLRLSRTSPRGDGIGLRLTANAIELSHVDVQAGDGKGLELRADRVLLTHLTVAPSEPNAEIGALVDLAHPDASRVEALIVERASLTGPQVPDVRGFDVTQTDLVWLQDVSIDLQSGQALFVENADDVRLERVRVRQSDPTPLASGAVLSTETASVSDVRIEGGAARAGTGLNLRALQAVSFGDVEIDGWHSGVRLGPGAPSFDAPVLVTDVVCGRCASVEFEAPEFEVRDAGRATCDLSTITEGPACSLPR